MSRSSETSPTSSASSEEAGDEPVDWSRAGAAAAGWVGRMLGRSVRRVVGVARDTRKAYRQGRDPRYEDAVVLEEYGPDEEADAGVRDRASRDRADRPSPARPSRS